MLARRIAGTPETDTAADQPPARRTPSLRPAHLQHAATQAKSNHDCAYRRRQRGEKREMRGQWIHRIAGISVRIATPGSPVTLTGFDAWTTTTGQGAW